MGQTAKHAASETQLQCRSIVINLSNQIAIQHKFKTIIPYQQTNSDEQSKSDHDAKEEKQSDDAIKTAEKQKNKNNTIQMGKFGWCALCGSPASHYCIQTRDP